jgi:hypothetical protein
MGMFFAILWGLLMGLIFLVWLIASESLAQGHALRDLVSRGIFGLSVVAAGAIVAGVLFGLVMAAYARWKAAQLRLPPWDLYPQVEPDDEDGAFAPP